MTIFENQYQSNSYSQSNQTISHSLLNESLSLSNNFLFTTDRLIDDQDMGELKFKNEEEMPFMSTNSSSQRTEFCLNEESLRSSKQFSTSTQKHSEELNPNVIKNLMRSFFHFILEEKNKEVVMEFLKERSHEQIQKESRRLIRQFKFNNTYIIRLLNKKDYSKLFEYYLTLEVQEWLTTSKIKDVNLHLRCIDFLKDCCVNKEKLQTIIKYKKKY